MRVTSKSVVGRKLVILPQSVNKVAAKPELLYLSFPTPITYKNA